MGTAIEALEGASEMDRFVVLMSRARKVSELVVAIRTYLSSWPVARVARVQAIDAGWAPFDERQQPLAILGPQDVRQVYDDVRDQVVSLKAGGVAPTPELLELELVLFLAQLLLDDLEQDLPVARAAPHARRQGRPHAGQEDGPLAAGR
jgi:hypothetical protein